MQYLQSQLQKIHIKCFWTEKSEKQAIVLKASDCIFQDDNS